MENQNLDVLLITPSRESNQYIVPPIGLGYLATALRKDNFNADIFDTVKKNLNQQQLLNKIKKFNPKILGIQLFGYDVSPSKNFLKLVRKELPLIKIILGGAHPTSEPKEVLNQFPEADYAFKGEAEEGLPLLVKFILRNKKINLKKIPGLIWRNKNKIEINKQLYTKNLDKYGFPAWDLINPKTYKEAPQGGFLKEYPYAPISTSRGCPFRCSYCTVHIVSGRKIRVRSINHVINEIKMLKEKYNVKEIHILDDAFTASKERVIDFCNTLINQKIKIKFSFPNGIRLDSLDEEVLLKMKQAGVQDFNVGVESGSDRILEDMKKSLTTKIIKEKTSLIRDTGLESNGFFIIGYPTEKKEDILKTIKFAKSIPLKRAQFSLFKAYPGTDITNKLLEEGKIEKINYDSFMYYKVDYVPEGLTEKELKSFQRRAFLEFYLRPKILFNLIKEINSIEHFKFILQRTWYSFFVSK
jgi:radical SAM superfamily enzyme YgiQ (UPF0313 family)